MKNPLKWLFKVKRVTANNQTRIYICYNIDRWWIGAELLHHYGIETRRCTIFGVPGTFPINNFPATDRKSNSYIIKPTFIKYI